MKLSDLTAKLTSSVRNIHGYTTRILAATALAGAALAAVPAAQAQHLAVGVQFGGPRYYAPPPPPPRVFFAPGYGGPAYAAPVYSGPVYGAPVYGAPVYGPGFWDHRRYEDWRRHEYFEHRGFYGPR